MYDENTSDDVVVVTGTMGVNELVYDLTGIDLDVTTKEDLNKDYRDEALSAIAFTPEPDEVCRY